MPACDRCGHDNPEDNRFCGNCGAPLAEAASAAREERKVVSVLFADLVGFTSRSERLDPEDVRAMLSPYFARVREEIERHGGTVEKFIGDAVMALFGAPVAHEDDPERAVRAALAIRDAIQQLNELEPALELQLRQAVTTGEALISLDARPSAGEGMASGDVVNTASRLQTAAPVDGILVTQMTYRAAKRCSRPLHSGPGWSGVRRRETIGCMRTRAAAGVAFACAVGLGLAAPAGAATIRVNCDNRALQPRIEAVAPGSRILVKGTCEAIEISKNLTLDGNPRATINADSTGRPITITGSPRVRLVDLRVTGGLVSGSFAAAGGISHPGGSLTLRRVAVVGNIAEVTGSGFTALGGGIYSTGGALRLLNSSVRSNTARALGGAAGAGGGGIVRTGDLILEKTRVVRNRVHAGSATMSANASGGGIVVSGGALTLLDSHVNGNRSTAVGTGPATGANAVGAGVELLPSVTRLSIRGSTVSWNRVTASLAGGAAGGEGGGLHGFTQRGSIRDTVLNGNQVRVTSSGGANTTANGGGGYLEAPGGLLVRDSRVRDSLVLATTGGAATGTGAGLAVAEGPFRLRSSRVADNDIETTGGTGPSTARGAGLIATATAVLDLKRSTVSGNGARADGPGGSEATGGGIAVSNARLRLRTSTVTGNVASAQGQGRGGGVILLSGGPSLISNSTIAANRAFGATARGGGVNTAVDLSVTNATLARNAARLGGGLYVEMGPTTLRATIVALNRAPESPDCGGPIASAGFNLIANTTECAFTDVDSDRTDVLPKLRRLAANGGPTRTIEPRRASLAVNAIPPGQCAFPKDQRGVRRPQGRRCDIGAVERRI